MTERMSEESAATGPNGLTEATLRTVRHDLRTPVNHIIGYCEMLIEDVDVRGPASLRDDLQRILAAGRQLLEQVSTAFDLTALEAGTLDLATVRHDLRTPLNHIIGYCEIVQDEAITLGYNDMLPDLRHIVVAATNMLDLITDHLMPPGGAAAPVLPPAPTLPPAPPAPESSAAAAGEPRTALGRLLVVDDDELNRDMLCRRLERLGYSVAQAENGREGLAILATVVFDIVLLDIIMPGLDGYQVLQRMKATPALRHIPVIMLSALDEVDNVVRCIELGAEDLLTRPFNPVLLRARIDACLEKKRLHDREVSYLQQIEREKRRIDELLNVVIPIGVALSAEKDFNRLLETIVHEAMDLCHADGGTLYLRTEDDQLQFVILRNHSLQIAMGGTSGHPVTFRALAMYDPESGKPNDRYTVTYAALKGRSVNIANAYDAEGFDFSGTRAFDKLTGYRSVSLLCVPLKDNGGRVLGVLQVINALTPAGAVLPFDHGQQQMIESLSALASVALEAYAREERLRRQIEELRIEVDKNRQSRQVAEITESDYFKHLQSNVQKLRERSRPTREQGQRSDDGEHR